MSVNENLVCKAQRAETIYIPKSGREQPNFVDWLKDAGNIDVPDFNERQYVKESNGQKFVIARSADIPELVSQEIGSVGSVGTDILKEFQFSQPGWSTNLGSASIGKSLCKVAVLGPTEKLKELNERLKVGDKIKIATSYPGIAEAEAIGRGYNFDIGYRSGCTEGAVANGKAEAVLDIVEKGKTMTQNGLDIVKKLWRVYPSIIWSNEGYFPTNENAPNLLNGPAIDRLIGTIASRANRVLVQAEQPVTYTEKLLANRNEMIKKFGSESAEFLQSFFLETDEDLASEAADLIYSIFVLLLGRQVDPKIAFSILQSRNEQNLRYNGS